jgi:hypothetical protein
MCNKSHGALRVHGLHSPESNEKLLIIIDECEETVLYQMLC